MSTRTVGIRAFRENMTKFLKEAQENNVHFIIMRHSEPVAHVTPARPRDSMEQLIADVAQARKDAAEGGVCTPEHVLAMIDANEARLHRSRRKRSR